MSWPAELTNAEQAVTGTPALHRPLRSREQAALDTMRVVMTLIAKHPDTPSHIVEVARGALDRYATLMNEDEP